MSASAAVDSLLDRLLAATESLCDSARAFSVEEASDLLASRRQIALSLGAALEKSPLTAEQRNKLKRAVDLDHQAREVLLIKRETTRRELQEALAGRHLSESFKAYHPNQPGRLNIKL